MSFPRHHRAEAGDRHAPHLREVGAQARDVADELTRARLSLGYDLDQVAEILRIRYDHLRAIEEGRFDDLPGPTYVVGFLRSYARYLGLDAEDLVTRFKSEAADFTAQQKLHFPSPIDEGRLPTGRVLLAALVLAGAAYGGWYYVNNIDRLRGPRVPEVPAELAEQARLADQITPETAAAAGIENTSEAAPETSAAVEPATDASAPATPPAKTVATATPGEISGDAPAAAAAPAPAPTVPAETPAAHVDAPSSATAETARIEPVAGPSASTEATAGAPPAPAIETPKVAALKAVTPKAVMPVVETPKVEIPKAATPKVAVAVPTERASETSAVSAVPPPAEAASDYVPRIFGRANTNARVRLRASQEAWVQITGADNDLVLTRIFRPGDVYLVPNRPGLTLMTGNAGGIEVIVDGKTIAPLGPVGAVRRDVVLDPARLLAGQP